MNNISYQISDTESYSLYYGYEYEGENQALTLLAKYGFTQDAFVPGLGQFQTIAAADPRKAVGKSIQVSSVLYGLDKGIRFLDTTGQGYITRGQRVMLSLNPKMAFPSSPFGKLLRFAGAYGAAIVAFDIIDWLAHKPIAQGQSFMEGLYEFATWGSGL